MRMSRQLARSGVLSGVLGIAAVVTVAGCSSTQVDHAAGRSPKLIPQTAFEGKICADGVVRDRSGAEIRCSMHALMPAGTRMVLVRWTRCFTFMMNPAQKLSVKPASDPDPGAKMDRGPYCQSLRCA